MASMTAGKSMSDRPQPPFERVDMTRVFDASVSLRRAGYKQHAEAIDEIFHAMVNRWTLFAFEREKCDREANGRKRRAEEARNAEMEQCAEPAAAMFAGGKELDPDCEGFDAKTLAYYLPPTLSYLRMAKTTQETMERRINGSGE